MSSDSGNPKPVKFYNLSLPERAARTAEQASLPAEALAALTGAGGLTPAQADKMVENVIGTYALPLGVAQNFVVNGREVLVPMVIEEPSVIAGASFMARLARNGGGFTAWADAPEMIGQMQVLDTPDPHQARQALLDHKIELLAAAAQIDPSEMKRVRQTTSTKTPRATASATGAR